MFENSCHLNGSQKRNSNSCAKIGQKAQSYKPNLIRFFTFIQIVISWIFQVITVFNFAPVVADCHKEFSPFVDILIVNEVEVSSS